LPLCLWAQRGAGKAAILLLGDASASLEREGQLHRRRAAMTLLASYRRTAFRSVDREANFGKEHSINYVLAFVALGIFVSLMTLALSGDWSMAW
jgi:hypothetical protein